MEEAAIRQKIAELTKLINRAPSDAPADDGIYVGHPSGAQATLQECMENLRLQVNYLAFDLEATRRENRYLRQMLESRPKPDGEDGSL